MSDDTPIWEQRQGEPALWYARFERYRLMGPARTLLACVREAPKAKNGKKGQDKSPPGAWSEAFAHWEWRSRALAWDEAERARLREKRRKEIEEAQERHANIARLLLQKGLEGMQAIDPATLTVEQSRALILTGANLEKTSLLEPLSNEAAELIKQLLAAQGAGRGASG